eukprot:1811775-Rhodomonas_salina.1
MAYRPRSAIGGIVPHQHHWHRQTLRTRHLDLQNSRHRGRGRGRARRGEGKMAREEIERGGERRDGGY